jgi:PTS system nitrogen regulatory IIA component
MHLTVRQVARYLKASEPDIYRWVGDQGLPAEYIDGQYRFNRAEVLEWATLRKMQIDPEFLQLNNGQNVPRLADALARGGIHYQVPGDTKEDVFRNMLQKMPLPADVDREFLLQVFLSREASGSTGIGEGLALPHPRYPTVLPVPEPLIAVCFLEKPVAYTTAGDQKVHTLFAMICPTVRHHLGLLARLSFALRDAAFREALRRQEPPEVILHHARRFDELDQEKQAGGATESRE